MHKTWLSHVCTFYVRTSYIRWLLLYIELSFTHFTATGTCSPTTVLQYNVAENSWHFHFGFATLPGTSPYIYSLIERYLEIKSFIYSMNERLIAKALLVVRLCGVESAILGGNMRRKWTTCVIRKQHTREAIRLIRLPWAALSTLESWEFCPYVLCRNRYGYICPQRRRVHYHRFTSALRVACAHDKNALRLTTNWILTIAFTTMAASIGRDTIKSLRAEGKDPSMDSYGTPQWILDFCSAICQCE